MNKSYANIYFFLEIIQQFHSMPAWKINNDGHCKQSGNANLELKTEEEELYKVGWHTGDDITRRTKSVEIN